MLAARRPWPRRDATRLALRYRGGGIRPLRSFLGGLFGPGNPPDMPDVPLKKSEAEWKQELSACVRREARARGGRGAEAGPGAAGG